MSYRIAPSLGTLRAQVDEHAPNRSKRSDGWIGDPAHAARRSDHNPDVYGVVRALDLTNDPNAGFSAAEFAEALRLSRDSRVKYVIWDRRMFSSYSNDRRDAWAWGSYSGSNPHTSHVHVSILPHESGAAAYNTDPWTPAYFDTAPAPAPEPPRPPAGGPQTYIVQPGDGWYRVASACQRPIGDVLAANDATIDTMIHPGQELKCFEVTCDGRWLWVANPRMTGPDVEWVQTVLEGEGLSLKVDGIYGDETAAMVKIMQGWNNLTQDGIVGAKTCAVLKRY